MTYNPFDCHVLSVDVEHSFGNSDAKECGSRKRVGSGSSCGSGSDSKACNEKMRRDRLNDRSHELCSILEPGRTPKMDKAVILSDAVQMLTQLRDESQKLKDSCDSLRGKINELKVEGTSVLQAEKNELREEKQKLKMGKENFCFAAIKSARHSTRLLGSSSAVPSPFAIPANLAVPFISFPRVPMWQLMPPAAVDTSQDHVLRPPVA